MGRQAKALLSTLLLVTLGLAGCMGANVTDGYYLGIQGSKSGTETGSFENSGTKATVAMGVQGSGSVKVVIKDADGATVYDKTITVMGQSGGMETTSAGKAGTWTVTLTFNDVNGQGGVAIRPA